MLKKFFLLLSLAVLTLSYSFAQNLADPHTDTLVISKDVTLPERSEYQNIVVVSGTVDLFGKVENLVVVKGVVRLHEGAVVKNKMVVLQGAVEQLKGSIVPDRPTRSFFERLKSWGQSWAEKWKSRFENPDADEQEEPRVEKWTKVFIFPFILAIPLSIVIVLFGLGMLFLMIAPKLSDAADEILKRDPFISTLWGSLAYLLLTPLLAILTISIVGIPLVPLVAFLAVLFVLAGFFSASRTLGQVILAKAGIALRALDTLLGIILLSSLIFIPFVGKLLVFFILIAGTGAVLRSIFGRNHIRFDSWRSNRVFDI